MKRKLLALALALVMLLGIAACDKGGSDTLIEIGDHQAQYNGAWLTKDYEGNDAIVIPFTYTNNSDEAASFVWSMFYTPTQGDTELEACAIFADEASFETLSQGVFEEVAPGGSVELALTYGLKNLTDPVVLKFSDLMDKETDELTIDVTELEAKNPSGSTGDPSENTGNPSTNGPKASFKEYEVMLVASEITQDSEGRTTLVLTYDYTNLDTGSNSFGWSVYDTGYQGGAELDTTDIYLEDGTSLRNTHYEEVAQNATLRVYEMYLLNDTTTAVEVQFTDLFETKVETITVDLTALSVNGGSEGGSEPEEPKEGYAFDLEFADGYIGDWHGMAVFYDCAGDYADNNDMQCDIAARIIFDENGYCEPYIRLCLKDPEDENLIVDSVDYDSAYNCMLLNGTLLKHPLDPQESFIELDETGEVLYIGALYDSGDGDVLQMLGCLRRLDDQWDYDNDYPALPQGGVDFYMGMTFEERIEMFGYDISLIPGTDEGGDEGAPVEEEAGIVTLQQLIDWKAWLNSVNTYENNYYTPTLEECVLAMGAEPMDYKLEQWNSDNIFVKWMTEDGKEHIIMTLRPTDDGEGWRYHSISWTGGVNG